MNRRTVRKAEALNGQKYIYIYIYIYKQTNKHTKEVKQTKKQIKKKQNKTKQKKDRAFPRIYPGTSCSLRITFATKLREGTNIVLTENN